MKWMIQYGLSLVLLMACSAPREEPDRRESQMQAVIENLVLDVVQPAYAALDTAAQRQNTAMHTLCAQPSAQTYQSAQDAFAGVVRAWSGAAFIRFGPVRAHNRYERLFYWPDVRGRGAAQIQIAIDAGRVSAEEVETKSVAAQGLLALEYILFSDGAQALSEGAPNRCAYGLALSENLAQVTSDVLSAWTQDGGFSNTVIEAGPDNALYQSVEEGIQAFMRAASEQVEVVHMHYLVPTLAETPDTARPRYAPFSRSNLTAIYLQGSLQGAVNVFDGRVSRLLPLEDMALINRLTFEHEQVSRVWESVSTDTPLWSQALQGPESHRKLIYSLTPLAELRRVIDELYPQALGFTLGFNALDGD